MRYKPNEACSTVGCNNPKAELDLDRYAELGMARNKKGKEPYTHGAFCTGCQAIEDNKSE